MLFLDHIDPWPQILVALSALVRKHPKLVFALAPEIPAVDKSSDPGDVVPRLAACLKPSTCQATGSNSRSPSCSLLIEHRIGCALAQKQARLQRKR